MSAMDTASLSTTRPVELMQPGTPSAGTAVLDSADLLQGQREILIRHQGHVYRLQATRQGKLILTK